MISLINFSENRVSDYKDLCSFYHFGSHLTFDIPCISISMSDTLQHLQKLKSRLSLTQSKAHEMTAVEKVDKLEQALSVFRTEVDMKLKIMQQILTTRNGNRNWR